MFEQSNKGDRDYQGARQAALADATRLVAEYKLPTGGIWSAGDCSWMQEAKEWHVQVKYTVSYSGQLNVWEFSYVLTENLEPQVGTPAPGNLSTPTVEVRYGEVVPGDELTRAVKTNQSTYDPLPPAAGRAFEELEWKPRYSNAQPIWQLVLLTVATLGLYPISWFYRNWKHLRRYKSPSIRPGWRTVGLFVPIYNVVLIYRQFRDIRNFAIETGCQTYSSPGWLTFGLVFLNVVSLALWRYMDRPDNSRELNALVFFGGSAIDLLTVILLAVVQKTLNRLWEKGQPGLGMRRGLSGGAVAWIIIGGIIWILVAIGLMMDDTVVEGVAYEAGGGKSLGATDGPTGHTQVY